METAKIFDMEGKELTVIDGGRQIKLTKSGKIKRTPNNNKESRTVYPIKDIKDVERCKEFLKKRADEAPPKYKKSYAKDLLLFKIGINVGLRASDLLKIQWEHVFKPGTKKFNKYFTLKEKKTGKTRETYINDSFRAAIKEYLTYVPDTKLEGYIFTNRQGEQLSDESINKLMKLLQNMLGSEFPFSTHTLRKTFAYHLYINSGKDLGLTQKILNHSSSYVTLKYIGLESEVQEKAYNNLNL